MTMIIRTTVLIAVAAVGITSSIMADQIAETIARLKNEIATQQAASEGLISEGGTTARGSRYYAFNEQPLTGSTLADFPYKFSYPAGYDVRID